MVVALKTGDDQMGLTPFDRSRQLAVGPLGRNAEGSGTLSSKGKVAAMYSYSKTKGLFGGVSLEGSVIVERQESVPQAIVDKDPRR